MLYDLRPFFYPVLFESKRHAFPKVKPFEYSTNSSLVYPGLKRLCENDQ